MSVNPELQRDLMAALGAAGLLGEQYNRVTRVVLVLDLNEVPRLTVSRILTDRDMTLLTGAIAEQEQIRQQRPARQELLWGTALGGGYRHLWTYGPERAAFHPLCLPDEWVDRISTTAPAIGPCSVCTSHERTGQLHDAQEVGK